MECQLLSYSVLQGVRYPSGGNNSLTVTFACWLWYTIEKHPCQRTSGNALCEHVRSWRSSRTPVLNLVWRVCAGFDPRRRNIIIHLTFKFCDASNRRITAQNRGIYGLNLLYVSETLHLYDPRIRRFQTTCAGSWLLYISMTLHLENSDILRLQTTSIWLSLSTVNSVFSSLNDEQGLGIPSTCMIHGKKSKKGT